MSRVVLALCAVLALSGLAVLSEARPLLLNPLRHRGALNQRISPEQHQQELQNVELTWFQQTLDHESLASTATFNQLYFVNDTYWNAKQPIVFLMIGGEGPLSPAYVNGHFVISSLAEKYGALQVALEHRFYGQSVPNNDSSTANLKFLSSAQALEDLVSFREFINKQYPSAQQPTWVVFGGSYSGNLAAWARLKYPNLFQGAYASSGPVRAELDFFQYFQVVAKSIGPTCSAVLSAGTTIVSQLLQNVQGRAQLAQRFNTCEPIVTDRDAANFVSALTNPVAETVQYNNDANRVTYNINTICGILEAGPDPLTAWVNLWNSYNNHTGQQGCTSINYESYIESMQPTSDARSWTWQTCTEFGYYQTAETPDQPFSNLISLQFFVDQCTDIFGIAELTPNINWTNDFYGGSGIVTSNTAFTNGDVDPWHILGCYENFSQDKLSLTQLVHGTAHCANLYSQEPTDLPALLAARAAEEALLRTWIFNPQSSQPTPVAAAPVADAPQPKHKEIKRIILTEF